MKAVAHCTVALVLRRASNPADCRVQCDSSSRSSTLNHDTSGIACSASWVVRVTSAVCSEDF